MHENRDHNNTFKCHYETQISHMSMSGDGSMMAFATRNNVQIVRIDEKKFTLVDQYVNTKRTCISHIMWSHFNGTLIGAATTQGVVILLDYQSRLNRHQEITAHKRSITRIAFIESTILTGSQDGSIKIFDIRAPPNASQIACLTSRCVKSIRDLRVNPCNVAMIASALDDGTVNVWDTRKPSDPIMKPTCHSNHVISIDWNPGRGEYRNHLVTCGQNENLIKIWDFNSCSEYPVLAIDTSAATGLSSGYPAAQTSPPQQAAALSSSGTATAMTTTSSSIAGAAATSFLPQTVLVTPGALGIAPSNILSSAASAGGVGSSTSTSGYRERFSFRTSCPNIVCWQRGSGGGGERDQIISTSSLATDLRVLIWNIERPFIPQASFSGHSDVIIGLELVANGSNNFVTSSRDCSLIHHDARFAERPLVDMNPWSAAFSPMNEIAFSFPQQNDIKNASSIMPAKCNLGVAKFDQNLGEAVRDRIGDATPKTTLGKSVEILANKPIVLEDDQLVLTMEREVVDTYLRSCDSVAATVGVSADPGGIMAAMAAAPPLYALGQLDEFTRKFVSLAKRYLLTGAPREYLVEHNARLAESIGRNDIAFIWRLLIVLFNPNVTLEEALLLNSDKNSSGKNVQNSSHSKLMSRNVSSNKNTHSSINNLIEANRFRAYNSKKQSNSNKNNNAFNISQQYQYCDELLKLLKRQSASDVSEADRGGVEGAATSASTTTNTGEVSIQAFLQLIERELRSGSSVSEDVRQSISKALQIIQISTTQSRNRMYQVNDNTHKQEEEALRQLISIIQSKIGDVEIKKKADKREHDNDKDEDKNTSEESASSSSSSASENDEEEEQEEEELEMEDKDHNAVVDYLIVVKSDNPEIIPDSVLKELFTLSDDNDEDIDEKEKVYDEIDMNRFDDEKTYFDFKQGKIVYGDEEHQSASRTPSAKAPTRTHRKPRQHKKHHQTHKSQSNNNNKNRSSSKKYKNADDDNKDHHQNHSFDNNDAAAATTNGNDHNDKKEKADIRNLSSNNPRGQQFDFNPSRIREFGFISNVVGNASAHSHSPNSHTHTRTHTNTPTRTCNNTRKHGDAGDTGDDDENDNDDEDENDNAQLKHSKCERTGDDANKVRNLSIRELERLAWPRHALHQEIHDEFESTLPQLVDDGYLQTVCSFLIVTSGTPRLDLLSKIRATPHQIHNWFREYLRLLKQHQLFVEAARVVKHCPLTKIARNSQESTLMFRQCGVCFAKLLPRQQSCPGRHTAEHVAACAICHLPVRGMYMWCHTCHHGGHLNHIAKWMNKEQNCPAGCGHVCQYLVMNNQQQQSPSTLRLH